MIRPRSGFTLIELLIVVVIIGILSAIAITRFEATKGKANLAAIKSDLHNLTTAQESFFYDSSKYSPVLGALAFSSSPGVTVTITEATNVGWSATATHPLAYPHYCAIFIGVATPVAPAVTSGAVACQ